MARKSLRSAWRGRNSPHSRGKIQPIEIHPMDDRTAQAIHYLQDGCPPEVLPLILAFCGPQQTKALSRVSKSWHALINTERTFRVLCEELYKWTPDQPEPASWKEYYQDNPCVPVDYPSIPRAIATITKSTRTGAGRNPRNAPTINYMTKSLRILLRPGTYYLKEGIHVQTFEDVNITIETMALPNKLYRAPPPSLGKSSAHKERLEISEQPLPPINRASPERPIGLRWLFSCSQNAATEESETDDLSMEESFEACHNHTRSAKLVLRTRKLNESVFCIRQGGITLKHLYIQHQSPGVDIWNGNAAIQIQPPLGEDGLAIMVSPSPFCKMESCTVSSQSGRGIVNIDGGSLSINKCMVKDCAATGIYIGGPGSNAEIESTDVIRNGVGNRVTRRGIARGHSGIYLEQGEAKITNSNISDNTLTGISVVSPENAKLSLRHSSLVSNGTYQLELPPPGTRSHQQSVHENNQLEFLGVAPLRSGLSHDE